MILGFKAKVVEALNDAEFGRDYDGIKREYAIKPQSLITKQ